MDRQSIKQLIEGVAEHRISVGSAVKVLLQELGRGGRLIVVDENLLSLEQYLTALNYTVYAVTLGAKDGQIKHDLKSRILITRNGKDFAEDVEKYYYGLIWVVSKLDDKSLAKKVEQVLMTHNFHHHLAQVVKV